MLRKAALILLLFCGETRFLPMHALAASLDSQMSEALQKKDWPSLVLLLKPKEGQNFEQDLILAKACLSLERRSEAVATLNALIEKRTDERAVKLRELAATQFFSQETANLYYESIRLISENHFVEAKERLEQVLVKEPGQGLALVRLTEVEVILNKKSAAQEHLKLASEIMPNAAELKIYAARLKLDVPETDDESDEIYKEAFRIFSAQKEVVNKNENPFVWWLMALAKLNRLSELNAIQAKLLKEHPQWSSVLLWYLKERTLSPAEKAAFLEQLQKNLKEPEKFNQGLQAEAKRSQYFWVGFFTYETIKAETQKLLNQPKP